MDHPLPDLPARMSRGEYYCWAERQPRGRFELDAGRVIPMPPERAGHARARALAWLALRQAITGAGARCEALPDGMTVEIDGDTAYEPDVLVNCGELIDPNAIVVPNPVIVVEVLSPSTRSIDCGAKLVGYFRVPSIRHYLVVQTDNRAVIHHRRREDGGIDTTLHSAGRLMLDPPGIAIEVEALYPDG